MAKTQIILFDTLLWIDEYKLSYSLHLLHGQVSQYSHFVSASIV